MRAKKKPTPYKLILVKQTKRYRLKFDEQLLTTLLSRDPEAFSLAFAKLTRDLQSLGRTIFLDPADMEQFHAAVKADDSGLWTSRFDNVPAGTHRLLRTFRDGFMLQSFADFSVAFEVAAEFYELIEKYDRSMFT